MNLISFRTSAALMMGAMLLAGSALAQQTRTAAPESPYGGTTVEDVIARVNDQIITRSAYDRAQKELDDEQRQRGANLQQVSEGHKDLLRNMIDQELWLSKGKELGITGETELVNRLNDIRKQYHLETMEDLEKAAKEQGVSFQDFKANIRNGIITQEVMRQEVFAKLSRSFTPGEVQHYYEEHKQDYVKPESVQLSEILVSVPEDADQAKLDAAKAKAAEIESKLHAGGDFSELARTFSEGPTAAQGGSLGQFRRGSLAKVLEEKTFGLKAGEITEPIRTRQGYVILKVVQHATGAAPAFKDVEPDVEQAFFAERMEPALREYLTKLREQSYIDIKAGYVDSGASAKQTKPIYSAYAPPQPKKKKKVERTRFRESTRSFRQKSGTASEVKVSAPVKSTAKTAAAPVDTSMKMGKKEKIRFGKAPTKTLPEASSPTTVEDAGAVASTNAAAAQEPVNPLEQKEEPKPKTRYSSRAPEYKAEKAKQKAKAEQRKVADPQVAAPPDAAEVADRQTQNGPLGLSGDTSKKKKKKSAATTGEKTRMADRSKEQSQDQTQPPTAPAPVTPQQ